MIHKDTPAYEHIVNVHDESLDRASFGEVIAAILIAFVTFPILSWVTGMSLAGTIFGHPTSSWFKAIVLGAVGLVFYFFRQRFRLVYGSAEFSVGFWTGWVVFSPHGAFAELQTVPWLQMLGALYIMVRGLDNIGQGLTGTRQGVIWKKIFERPKKREPGPPILPSYNIKRPGRPNTQPHGPYIPISGAVPSGPVPSVQPNQSGGSRKIIASVHTPSGPIHRVGPDQHPK